jgi:HK97 family phage prohead protease
MLHRHAHIERTNEIADSGEFSAVISTGRRDAYGDELVVAGADLDDYTRNPILLHEHSTSSPIGKAIAIERLADRIVARFRLLSKGVSQAADGVRQMIGEGVLNMLSVGFEPLEREPIDGAGQRFLKWKLYEVSTVAIGANPDALIVERAKGIPMTTPAIAEPRPATVPVTRQARTLYEHVRDSDILAHVRAAGRGRAEFALALRTITTTQAAVGDPKIEVPAQSMGLFNSYVGIVYSRLLDALRDVPVSSNAVELTKLDYKQPDGNKAAKIAETELKPESILASTPFTATIDTWAHHVTASRQVLDDVPGLREIIDTLLRDGLLDKIDAAVYATLAAAATAFTPTTGDTIGDALARAAAQIRMAGGRDPVIAINPADLLTANLAKASTSGTYLGLPPNGASLVQSSSVPAGSLLGWDRATAAVWLDRQAVQIEVGLVNDQFVKNCVTILCETRGAVAAIVPPRIVSGDLVAAP